MSDSDSRPFDQASAGMDFHDVSEIEHAEVLAEIDRLQQKQGSWGNAVLILVISVLLFFGIGTAAWSWEFAALLIPILFIHELGHYLAMLAFGYRNVRMFFIPLFGAAVSGRNFNVAGWKKAVVSLMGPVPGIGLGVVLGIAALLLDKPLLLEAAIMALILNGFNLLPVLPLDGGWVFHSILFSRHQLLDAAFRVMAVLGLFAAAALTGGRILMWVGIWMLLGLRTAFRTSRILANLRELDENDLAPAAADDQTIPAQTAGVIVGEVVATFPTGMTRKTKAQLTLDIYERLNARPPGWLVTSLLAGVHFASFAIAVVFAAVFVIAQHADLGEFVAEAANTPQRAFACGTAQSWQGAEAQDNAPTDPRVIIANFAGSEQAQRVFHNMTGHLPARAQALLFGQSIFLTIAADDDASREKWVNELEPLSDDVFVDREGFRASVTMVCIAPTENDAKEMEQEAAHYFSVPTPAYLVPPWSAKHKLTREFRRSRRTYARIQDTVGRRYSDPRLQALQTRSFEAQRRGDVEAAAKANQERSELLIELEKAGLQTLRRQGADDVDVGLIEVYTARPVFAEGDNDFGEKNNAWLLQLGERMGQLPLEAEQPKAGEHGDSAESGYIKRTGLLLRFSVAFADITAGLPALADWLCARGCVDVKYDVTSGFGDFDPEILEAFDAAETAENADPIAAEHPRAADTD